MSMRRVTDRKGEKVTIRTKTGQIVTGKILYEEIKNSDGSNPRAAISTGSEMLQESLLSSYQYVVTVRDANGDVWDGYEVERKKPKKRRIGFV